MHVCCYFCNYFGAMTNLGSILESLNRDIILGGGTFSLKSHVSIHLAVIKEEKETAYNMQLLTNKMCAF